jgi:hypothetical protein
LKLKIELCLLHLESCEITSSEKVVATTAASATTEMITSCNPRTLPRTLENSFTVNNKTVGLTNQLWDGYMGKNKECRPIENQRDYSHLLSS